MILQMLLLKRSRSLVSNLVVVQRQKNVGSIVNTLQRGAPKMTGSILQLKLIETHHNHLHVTPVGL